jgi:protein subunit release factor B
MSKDPFFSITAKDCEWSYTKGTGAGGQKRNKTSSAVHCIHKASGAHGYSESSRSQLDNRQEAFRKMAESDKFKKWLHVEYMKRTGEHYEMERQLTESLKKVRLEVKIDGKWTEVKENQLVDHPDLFDTSVLNLRV